MADRIKDTTVRLLREQLEAAEAKAAKYEEALLLIELAANADDIAAVQALASEALQ